MTDEQVNKMTGAIEWRDLTVEDAEAIRAFYADVVGWQASAVSMGDYDDFNMNLPETGETVAGICHARGDNQHLPNQWLMYVRVKSVHDSAARCQALGGMVLEGPRIMGGIQFCVIRDPQGAVLGLISDN